MIEAIAAALLFAVQPAAEAAAEAAPSLTDRDTIWRLRNETNRALRARDLAAFASHYADDILVVGGSGGSRIGKAQLREAFQKEFADKSFVTYVRTPATVRVGTIGDRGLRAAEQGRWTGQWRDSRGETIWSGDYMAHWVKTGAGWRIRAEVYVSLACIGPGCSD